MKKVIGVAAFAVLGMLALSSCKKDYVCTADGVVISECTNCGKTTKSAFDTTCSLAGATVSVK